MRVVFLEDVAGVAQGGDVKDVKNGFARNYLIPKNLAVPAAHNALQRVDRLAKEAETTRLKTLADMKALATALDGVRVDVEMRSGAGGRLYGSVTNIIIAEELSKLTGREIDRRIIQLDEPIRQLGLFDLDVHLHAEVDAKIGVLVYAMGTDPAVLMEALEEASEAEETPSVEAVVEGEQPEKIEEDQSRKAEPESVSTEETLAEAETPDTIEAPETESEPEEDP
jgi:large subunit ribosomal protein L9|tara:strand:- start:295 stop:969 length:675 start_codon:yes stop_codon:yes gene_type:complete